MIGNKKPGLTLIEILIVVAIFATSAVILSQIFVQNTRLQRRVANMAGLSQEMRFVMELLTRETRNKIVNYDPTTGYTTEVSIASSEALHLVNRAGEPTNITVESDPTICGAPVKCLAYSTGAGPKTAITGKSINIKFFNVSIRPTKSPFALVGGSYSSNVQPFATFTLELEYLAPSPRDNSTLLAQTTVSSRIYQR